SELAERLSTFLVDPPRTLSADIRAFLWEYVGDLNYQVLRRNRDAQVAFEAAKAAGKATPTIELKAARAMSQQPGKGREAVAAYGKVLSGPGVGLTEWLETIADLEALFEGVEDAARVRIIKQIDDVLRGRPQSDAENLRIKRDPARQVEGLTALECLSAGMASGPSMKAAQLVSKILNKELADRRPRRRALGGKKLKGNPELSALIDLAASTLQADAPKVFVGQGGTQTDWLADNMFFVPSQTLEEADAMGLRFWAGHIVGATAFGLGALALAEPGEIESVLTEVCRLEKGESPSDDPFLKEVASRGFAEVREELAALIEQNEGIIESVAEDAWIALPRRVADRFGLLMTGDVRAAVGVLSSEGPGELSLSVTRPEDLVTQPRPKALLEFALGHAYQELRYHCGLAARPRPV
ncbi:MAG: hypothetical protein KC561_15415, partial [Myxococcales bacterium]|nr:hypothetical protein [Myxococcales bacterium]